MPENFSDKNKDLWTKLMFGVLCFFGVFTLIFGVFKVSQTVNLSPAGYNENINTELDFSAGVSEMQLTIEELQASDTDGDGLNDFEELYVYRTSPYLADSDSDGYSDKQEIDGGYDPNCPKGQDCRGAGSTTGSETAGGATESDSKSGLPETSGELPDETREQLQNLSASELRQLLLESGQISKEQLDQIDDETLMRVFGETLNQ